MGQNNKYSNYSFEAEVDSNIDDDPNFDLDEYIRQKSQPQDHTSPTNLAESEEDRSQFKNAILIFMVFAAAFLWVNDWSVAQAWNSVFGNEEIASTAPSFDVEVPEINIPDIPAPPVPPGNVANQEGYVNYLASLNEAGYSEFFSTSQTIGLYNGGVSIDYLDELNAAGFLEQFSYSAIIGLYNGDVTINYLSELESAGYIDQFSYSAIIGLYNGDVSIEYLNELNTNGYLEDFSYSAIIALYNTDVSVSFLDQLRDNGMIDDMSYTDIIMAYNADN